MNFFDAQDQARRATRWLVVVYIISTALIVAGVTLIVGVALFSMGMDGRPVDLSVLAIIAIAATLFILGSSLYKTSRLSAGGGRVALDMGGTLVPPNVQDPLRRQLRNVVEEMAIASGVPVPEIYVLEEESGINAFAAGFAPGDAAVAVTRGTLELLNRDELQGVIAHEFSHILNGDMRLNIRMMGVLFGIMVLGLIGRMILRSSYHTGLMPTRRNKNAPAIMMLGLGLAILGWIGVFFARIVKAAVSRQREFLADASAVQFTRQSDGIANALKKIGGYSRHSYITATDPEEISHMLFAGGTARLTSLLATHPPLTERIQALDPQFNESEYPDIDPREIHATDAARQTAMQESRAATGLAGGLAGGTPAAIPAAIAAGLADAVGQPKPHHVAFAKQLRQSIPDDLYDAAHSAEGAFLLTVALTMNKAQAATQLRVVEEQMGAKRAAVVSRYFEHILEAGTVYRLPLLEIAFPMLKQRPEAQLEFLIQLVRRLIEVDGHISLSEYCFYRIVTSHLIQAADPVAAKKGNRVAKKAAQRAAVELVRVVAEQGNEDPQDVEHAFAAGIAKFGKWASAETDFKPTEASVDVLDETLETLRHINSAGQQSLLGAVSKTITHDGKLTITEAELLRAICASLECPLPPLLADYPPNA
ncbi:MAG: Zn-dependent protease with chaperone function [Woeseiaceae bacterium]